MFKLTYKNKKGYPVNLVFDSYEEAEKWGAIYSCQNGGTTYTIA
tara:strand:+ start:342 stop:473 length:132 start_codon:yes stop_codon:yes gene_type:complete